MRAWLASLVAGPNAKADEMAILSILTVLAFLGISVFSYVVLKQPWVPDNFGDGAAKILGAAAVGMGIKARLGG